MKVLKIPAKAAKAFSYVGVALLAAWIAGESIKHVAESGGSIAFSIGANLAPGNMSSGLGWSVNAVYAPGVTSGPHFFSVYDRDRRNAANYTPSSGADPGNHPCRSAAIPCGPYPGP